MDTAWAPVTMALLLLDVPTRNAREMMTNVPPLGRNMSIDEQK
jgi:hypothetical protein